MFLQSRNLIVAAGCLVGCGIAAMVVAHDRGVSAATPQPIADVAPLNSQPANVAQPRMTMAIIQRSTGPCMCGRRNRNMSLLPSLPRQSIQISGLFTRVAVGTENTAIMAVRRLIPLRLSQGLPALAQPTVRLPAAALARLSEPSPEAPGALRTTG